MKNLLARAVRWISGRVWAQLSVVVLMTLAAVAMAVLLAPKSEYLPEGNRDIVFSNILPPPGYNVAEFERMAESLEQDLAPYYTAKPGTPEAAKLDAPPIQHMFFFARGQTAFMGVRPYFQDVMRTKEFIPVIQRALRKLPGVIAIVRQPSLFGRAIAAGRSIDVEITGPDLPRLIELGGRMFGQLRALMPEAQMRPIPSLDLGNPEVRVLPDRVRLSEVGLNPQDLGLYVDLLLDGVRSSEYRFGSDNIDLTVMGEPGRIQRTQDFFDLPIRASDDRVVTLGSLANIQTMSGPIQINHVERNRAVAIQVIPPQTMPLQSAMETIEEKVIEPLRKSGELGEFYQVKLAGTADDLTRTRNALSFNFLLALIITYLLMASLFESFVYPLVIMFSVPLGAAGGFLGLWAMNRFISFQAMDVLTMLGFVILIGTVVNNAILIVHQGLNNIRYEGLEYPEAIAESVRTRLRPILMSTATSVFGMLPLVLFPGAGSELYRGLGSVVIGGLVVSTVFTLFLIPALFALVLRIEQKLGRAPKPEVSWAGY